MAFGCHTTLRYRCISTIIKQIKVRLRTYSSLLLRSQSRDRHESTGLDCCNSLGRDDGTSWGFGRRVEEKREIRRW